MPAHLSVQRPSPTTVLFTVSNASTRSGVASRALKYAEFLPRIVIFLFILLLCAAKIRPYAFYYLRIMPLASLWRSGIGKFACQIADAYSWELIGLCSSAILWAVVRKGSTVESLLVIRGLGVQTSTSSSTYLSTATTRFIPTTQIQDIVIHEAFKGFQVKFYLAVIVEGEPDIVVVFPHLLPRRAILEEVWRGARKCLYDPKS